MRFAKQSRIRAVASALAIACFFWGIINGCGRSPDAGEATKPPMESDVATNQAPVPAPETSPNRKDDIPTAVEVAVRETASALLAKPLAQLTLISAQPQDWPDACLGLATPEEFCAAVVVPGWSVIIGDGQQEWTFRTDEMGSQVRLETGP